MKLVEGACIEGVTSVRALTQSESFPPWKNLSYGKTLEDMLLTENNKLNSNSALCRWHFSVTVRTLEFYFLFIACMVVMPSV